MMKMMIMKKWWDDKYGEKYEHEKMIWRTWINEKLGQMNTVTKSENIENIARIMKMMINNISWT